MTFLPKFLWRFNAKKRVAIFWFAVNALLIDMLLVAGRLTSNQRYPISELVHELIVSLILAFFISLFSIIFYRLMHLRIELFKANLFAKAIAGAVAGLPLVLISAFFVMLFTGQTAPVRGISPGANVFDYVSSTCFAGIWTLILGLITPHNLIRD